MRKYFHQLLQKPESHKKRVAYGVSAIITLVIAGVWATSFQYFYGIGVAKEEVAKVNTDNSPLNVLKSGVASVYEAITGSKVEFVKDESGTSKNGTLEYIPESVSAQVSTSSTDQLNNL